jgi:hypothetical protein
MTVVVVAGATGASACAIICGDSIESETATVVIRDMDMRMGEIETIRSLLEMEMTSVMSKQPRPSEQGIPADFRERPNLGPDHLVKSWIIRRIMVLIALFTCWAMLQDLL